MYTFLKVGNNNFFSTQSAFRLHSRQIWENVIIRKNIPPENEKK
jgi:hypothetical protein